MPSLKRHEGWLMIDHRASPGIPPDVAVKLGFLPEEVEEGALFEGATITCKHCATAYTKNPRRIRPRGYCKACDHYVCDECDGLMQKADYVHRCREETLDSVMNSAHRGQVFDPSAPKAPTIYIP
jgi:hypothetical protein